MTVTLDLKEIGWEGLECIYLSVDRDMWQSTVKKGK
jgi:hypothetical protein